MTENLYCDSSLTEYCFQFDDEPPVRLKHIPQPETHNIGEYLAVEHALGQAIVRNLSGLDVFTDSQLVEGQVNKDWKVNVPHLRGHVKFVRDYLALTKSTLHWIPREENLAGIELDRRKK